MKQMYNRSGFNRKLEWKRFETIKGYLRGPICLEVGGAEGYITKKLIKYFMMVYSIEPNKNYSASEADNMFISIEELIEETEEEFDSIKEEINRIKSLFNNERIYGNLIKD